MESITMKAENLKPIILKAGFPLAVYLAGVIYAWIITKKTLSRPYPLSEIEAKSESDTPKTRNSYHGIATIIEESVVTSGKLIMYDESSSCLEQDNNISGSIRSNIEDLKMRELALNLRFERYCDMKEQESLLMEIKNMLSLESARVEFLHKEVQSLEAVNMRLENFVVQYLRVVEKLEFRRSENRLMHRKVQKLAKKLMAQSRLIKEQNTKIKAGEAEIMRNNGELQINICVINKLEDQIKELKGVFDQLHDEKNELLKNLDTTEKAYESQIETKYISKEDYNKILNELEQIKNDRTAEAEELIRLRWTNACLKHELNKHNQQQQHEHQGRDHNIGVEFEEGNGEMILHYESDHELHHYSSLNHHHNNNVHCFGSPHSDEQHAYSKRKRLLRMLKRWVQGEGENHHDDAKETHVPARISFSSA